MSSTIDQATKVNIGILGTLIVAVIGATVYLSTLQVNVIHISATLGEVKSAIDRTNLQLAVDSKTLAVLESMLTALERRVSVLETGKGR